MTTVTAHDLAERVVEAVAPAELPSFALVAAPYLDHPARAERAFRRFHDDPLGFGLGDAVEMITPVVALVSGSVITALSDGVGEAVKTGAGKVFRKLVKRRAVEAPVQEWSADELARVRAIALVRAKALGVEERQAEALADAIVVALLLERDDPR
ncbi:hypothetical protein ACFFQW_05990 [Umezawaea endophytica]|uniref:Uncharacterized protein n=1 Tax=Umezawaea endophytica TaxID=1654476 RepID=A0A9X2VRQ2_9PSEU|nr:hypothetical protein [Umezawaea endophytica]MCS7481122.1 hypothetical protein [Umezawaea endophytica]